MTKSQGAAERVSGCGGADWRIQSSNSRLPWGDVGVRGRGRGRVGVRASVLPLLLVLVLPTRLPCIRPSSSLVSFTAACCCARRALSRATWKHSAAAWVGGRVRG